MRTIVVTGPLPVADDSLTTADHEWAPGLASMVLCKPFFEDGKLIGLEFVAPYRFRRDAFGALLQSVQEPEAAS